VTGPVEGGSGDVGFWGGAGHAGCFVF
jgi:hypothetical protein